MVEISSSDSSLFFVSPRTKDEKRKIREREFKRALMVLQIAIDGDDDRYS